jgi:hypothetical protein
VGDNPVEPEPILNLQILIVLSMSSTLSGRADNVRVVSDSREREFGDVLLV